MGTGYPFHFHKVKYSYVVFTCGRTLSSLKFHIFLQAWHGTQEPHRYVPTYSTWNNTSPHISHRLFVPNFLFSLFFHNYYLLFLCICCNQVLMYSCIRAGHDASPRISYLLLSYCTILTLLAKTCFCTRRECTVHT